MVPSSRKADVSEAIGEEGLPGDLGPETTPETERQDEQAGEPAGKPRDQQPRHAGAGARASGLSAIGACIAAAKMPRATDAHQIGS